ncbi:MAG: hypothetical protein ACI35R_17590 [Bacillus sp. (in: firmicutes)]
MERLKSNRKRRVSANEACLDGGGPVVVMTIRRLDSVGNIGRG